MSDKNIDDFFSAISPISDWMEMGGPNAYKDLPENWWLLMTDLKGSTKAIQEGKYKQVNILGVCAIIGVQNSLGNSQFPYIFGGDGATLFVPASMKDKALEALSYTRKIAKEEFGFHMRVFSVDIKTLRQAGKNIAVARIVRNNQSTFLFRGGGITYAEDLMKKDLRYELSADHPFSGGHEGLECRWKPIASHRGSILSLIIKPLDENNAIEALLFNLQHLLQKAQPIKAPQISYSWPPKDLLSETRARNKSFVDFLKALSYTLLVSVWLYIGKKTSIPVVIDYLNGLESNNDFFKRDDSLRLVLDVTEQEKNEIFAWLKKFKERGLIQYGYHESSAALMTCLFRGAQDHFHFIDGSHGGYAKAAEMLKKN